MHDIYTTNIARITITILFTGNFVFPELKYGSSKNSQDNPELYNTHFLFPPEQLPADTDNIIQLVPDCAKKPTLNFVNNAKMKR
jgi:hypothetical protein